MLREEDIVRDATLKMRAAAEEARVLIDRAQLEKRELTTEEETRFNERMLDADRYREIVKKAESYIEGRPHAAEVHKVIGGTLATDDGTRGGHDQIRDMLESGERAMTFSMPTSAEWNLRAVDTTTATFAPSDFASYVSMYMRTESPWIGLATTVNATEGNPLIVPTLTTDPTAYTPGQGTAITESSGTLGNVTVSLTSYKALSYISAEAIQDSSVNLTQLLSKSAARQIALDFGSAATTAILAAINNGGTAAGTPFLDYNDLLSLEYGRQAPYRTNGRGSWVMSNGAALKARKWTDSNGQYLWTPLAAGQPGGLSGHAVFEDPYLATPASATKSVLFGDWEAALVIKSVGLRVEVSRDYLFATDQVAVKTVWRAGIKVQDATAAAFLVSGNS